MTATPPPAGPPPIPAVVIGSPAPPRRSRLWLAPVLSLAGLLALIGGGAVVLANVGQVHLSTAFTVVAQVPDGPTDPEALRRRAAKASAALDRLRPDGTIVVVDTYRNRLRLYRDGELIRSAVCSTGTGRVLRDPRTGRQWVFDSPMGERVINKKAKNPIWGKPDWAFIEEGYLPPPPGSPERFDDVSLGDYGLYMGDGFIIHGTLFKTLLGRRVTHGCIRLGDEDLEFVYENVPIGSRVYLY